MVMKALVLLAPPPGSALHPEEIRHAQSERNHGPTDHQEPTIALLFASLLGFFGSTLCQLGGGLW